MPQKSIETFRTHSNYIKAFNLLVHDPISSGALNLYQHLRNRILQANVLPQSHNPSINLDQVRSSLQSAWGTETLLLMTKRIIHEDELLRLSNNWSSIQVYYIFYHCTQALHVARGHPNRPESHPATQNLFYDYWASRSTCLPPWSLAFGHSGAINVHPMITPDTSIHPWTACDATNAWSLALKSLMTTRREALEEHFKKQRENKRRQNRRAWEQSVNSRLPRASRPRQAPIFRLPRLSNEEKANIDLRLRPYTIMDYLYRLRLKTNYEDSNMFSDGPEDDNSSRYIRNALCRIANGTLFLHELAIRNLVGRESFLSWIDDWIRRYMPQNTLTGLAFRRRYLDGQ